MSTMSNALDECTTTRMAHSEESFGNVALNMAKTCTWKRGCGVHQGPSPLAAILAMPSPGLLSHRNTPPEIAFATLLPPTSTTPVARILHCPRSPLFRPDFVRLGQSTT